MERNGESTKAVKERGKKKRGKGIRKEGKNLFVHNS
jgi:hypothetical protein